MKWIYIVFLGIGIWSCNSSNTNAEEMVQPSSVVSSSNGEQNKAIVDSFLAAGRRGDVNEMSKYLTDDFVQYGLGVNDSATKSEVLESTRKHFEVYNYQGQRYKRIQSLAVTTHENGTKGREKGDWVFEWGEESIDYPASADIGGKPITATFAFHAVFQIKQGKIFRSTIYFNHEDISRQLGFKMISVPEQEKAKEAGIKVF
ncbi:MAG: nuclear transport factor 2 family protein [Flavipsychrobacter sp.]|nr:nuclear transport factor 2 family protein [Flavipsychrobacter sp.]